MPEHHFALGDEQPLPPDEIPLPDLPIGLDPGVVQVVDQFEAGHGRMGQ